MIEKGKIIVQKSATYLRPAVASWKNQIELEMSQKSQDHVVHNPTHSGGITDLSFEVRKSKRETKKVASLHFKMDAEGVAAYRKAAANLCDVPTVELSYTPYFGQSRISFEWDSFWEFMNDQKYSILEPGSDSLKLLPSKESDGNS